MEQKNSKAIRAMTECSIMIALSTVLNIIKLIEMPYGGSVTIASMLPIVVAVYRHGTLWGITTAVVNAASQLLLGLNNLSYFTTWQSIVAIILLDYIVAFGAFAISGIFKKVQKRQSYAMLYGALLASVIRYGCHVISGATVWAGLSIPTEAALLYSLSYNLTYMLPETIVLLTICAYTASIIDFKAKVPTRVKNNGIARRELTLTLLSGLSLVLTVIADVAILFPNLQDAETGEFTFSYMAGVNWILFACVSLVGIAASLTLFIIARIKSKKQS
ncbi:MAG: energy-coupled thiamine transporter ThiT [Clostridia bacterium]|nr:energy-coupled thiamine transporter ThiT [Clostridia bacterium]